MWWMAIGCGPVDLEGVGGVERVEAAVVAAPAIGAGGAEPHGAPEIGPTNVLVILLDDVATERLAVYGLRDDPPVTPTIDRLAAEGVTFDHAWSTPLCSPSRAALLTGRYPSRTGIGGLVDSWRDVFDLDPAEVTIPEMLDHSADEWDSSLVGKWHVASQQGGPPELDPLDQGFRWAAGSLSNLRDPYGGYFTGDLAYDDWMETRNGDIDRTDEYATLQSGHDAAERIAAMHEPWFLYLPLNSAHEPFHEPPADLYTTPLPPDPTPAQLYDRMIESADTVLGRLLDDIDPEVLARTTIVLAGDNGTPIEVVRAPYEPKASKGSVYELGVDVPLIVTGPHVRHPGAHSEALVHLVDVFATVADIAGVDTTELGVPIDGRSLLPAVRDPSAPVHELLFTETFDPNGFGERTTMQRAIRDERYKFVQHVSIDPPGYSEELYDLEGTLLEGDNLLDDPALASVVDQLRSELALAVE